MGSYIVAAIGLAVLAASAAALTGSWQGERFADPVPTVTVTVEAPKETPKIVTDGDHTLFDIPAENAPTVVLTVTPDAAIGYNVHMETTNFTWTPENVNLERVAGEGHAHIYVDGVKIGRFYGPDAHITAGGPGSTFVVYLAANDHSEFAVDGVADHLDRGDPARRRAQARPLSNGRQVASPGHRPGAGTCVRPLQEPRDEEVDAHARRGY